MKRFKVGFLALVAIAAMSFTVTSKATAVKEIISNCFTHIVANGTSYDNNVTPTPLPPPNTPVSAASGQGTITCNGTGVFCCATLQGSGSTLRVLRAYEKTQE